MSKTSDKVKEIYSATIKVKGNALIYGNSIYSISNILSVSFDSIEKEKDEPRFIKFLKKGYLFFIQMGLLFSVIFILGALIFVQMNIVESYQVQEFLDVAAPIILLSLAAGFLIFALWLVLKIIFILTKKYTVYGLAIELVTGKKLVFISTYNGDFIEETVSTLYTVIADEGSYTTEYKIDFYDKSISHNKINIERANNANVVGGNVSGNVSINGEDDSGK